MVEIEEEWLRRVGRLDFADHPDGAVAIEEPVRMVKIGESFEEPVILIESSLEWPRVPISRVVRVALPA
jgi:hypothetical protein